MSIALRIAPVALASLLGVAGLAACSDDSSPTPTPAPTSTSTAAASTPTDGGAHDSGSTAPPVVTPGGGGW